MKTKLIKFFITTFVIVIVAMGVSYVSAQNIPPNGPTDPNTYTTDLPIFTGSALQEKKGSFLSQKHIGAPVGFFKKSIYLPGSDARLRIGSSDNALSINPALFGDDSTEPVVIDMQNRSATRDATKFINGGLCAVATRLVTTGSQAYEFKTGNNLGNVIARQVQLTGGDPDAGEVLVSDSSGNARWAKAEVSGGQIVFSNNSVSPVPAGQCITPEPIVDVCTNIDGDQSTVPTGMVKDTPGTTPGNCTIPPVDVCTNIDGDQSTVPTGMVKDTPGTTPGNCTIPPVDLCPNIAGVQTTIPYGKELKSDGNCGEVCRFGVGVQYSTAMNGEVSAASLNESALLQSSYADSLGTYCTYSHPGCTGNGCGFALSVNKPAGYTCSVTSVYAGNIGGETTCVNNSNSQTKTYICPVEVPLTSKQGVYGYDDVVIPFTGTPKRPISIENGKIVCSIKDRTFEFTHFKPF
jgi:hypothetical protein